MDYEDNRAICGTSGGFVELEQKDLCYVDEETMKTLELLENSADRSNRKHSLYGYLNDFTCTTSGSRLIRSNILRPLCHLQTIQHRLDCIEYLVNHLDVLGSLTNCLKVFGNNIDLDKVVNNLASLLKCRTSSLAAVEKRLDALTTLEVIVTQVKSLTATLEQANQPVLEIYRLALEDPAYDQILNVVYEFLQPEVKVSKSKRNRMYKIRQGCDNLFDISRSTYSAAMDDLEEYVRDLQREDGISWKLTYSETRGFYLSLSQVPKNLVFPSKYIRINRTRQLVTCTTSELWQMDIRARMSYENSMKLAHEILSSAISQILGNLAAICKLVDIVGTLDLMTSFAKLVALSNGRLVKPTFGAMDTIITKSRHPVLESVLNMSGLQVEPNNVIFSGGTKNFMLVTGPNMGGKSVFLKQVALIQVMAQLGCYVPAESAHMKLMNRIVARSGTGDDSLSNCSSFMSEMRGIATTLEVDNSISNPSVLYVIDEVGRGTSIDDGASYSFAIAEELALRRNCFTVFATHFDLVFTLTSLYGNVTAYHFKYEDDEGEELKISHVLEPGISRRHHYGIRLAAACRLPSEIIKVAVEGLQSQSAE